MARASRGYIPGLIWHITHRCHKREFLLKFFRDRKRWLFWLFKAKKRYGLCVLNYAVTCNHIHLLVNDVKRRNIIPEAMRLIAGRTAQEYNQRKNRRGAFWEDRYHATAVESDIHLNQCMVYIDMNMVRAGVVNHPKDWPFCGYNEILSNQQRYKLIDDHSLIRILNMKDRESLKQSYTKWIADAIETRGLKRESRWTESLAVGSKEFIERINIKLGLGLRDRIIREHEGVFELHECIIPYGD